MKTIAMTLIENEVKVIVPGYGIITFVKKIIDGKEHLMIVKGFRAAIAQAMKPLSKGFQILEFDNYSTNSKNNKDLDLMVYALENLGMKERAFIPMEGKPKCTKFDKDLAVAAIYSHIDKDTFIYKTAVK